MPKGKKAAGGVNKMDVVREIIDKHGKDTKPLEIVSFAKKEHGMELGASHGFQLQVCRPQGTRFGREAEGQERTEARLEEGGRANGTAQETVAASASTTSKRSRSWWSRWGRTRWNNWPRYWRSELGLFS